MLGQQPKSRSFILDPTIEDSARKKIQFHPGRHFVEFKTPVEARFFLDGQLADSIVQPDYSTISWYRNQHDTIELVAHVSQFETAALLVRFVKGEPSVWYYRAPHDIEGSRHFRTRRTNTFAHEIEVAPISYRLKLSQLPDTVKRPLLFGYVEMESDSYFDNRDSVEQKHSAQLKFYFCSQYRQFR